MGKKDGKFKPCEEFVLIKQHDKEEQVTPGGITLPVSAENMGLCYADIVEVGPGRYLENGQRAIMNDIKPGDVVLVAAGKCIPLNAAQDRKVMLVDRHQILAVEIK
jgi:co-chaperonin GroES (HSP10)